MSQRALAVLSGLGLVMGIDPLDRLLEEPAYQFIGRFEHRRADQDL